MHSAYMHTYIHVSLIHAYMQQNHTLKTLITHTHTHTHTQIPVAMRLSQHMLTLNVREPNLHMPALNRN